VNFEENKLKHLIRKKERKKYSKEYFKAEYWKEDYLGTTGNQKFSYDDPSHRKRFFFLADLLQKHFEFDSFIDAGCGLGLLVEIMTLRGITSHGFDVATAAFKGANKHIRSCVVVGGIEAVPFSSSCADLVFCSDVLEHVPVFDISLAISELVRIASRYIVVTVNLDNPYLYHPTILSRQSWVTLFQLTMAVRQEISLGKKMQSECKMYHPEYEFFVFKKLL